MQVRRSIGMRAHLRFCHAAAPPRIERETVPGTSDVASHRCLRGGGVDADTPAARAAVATMALAAALQIQTLFRERKR